jgi:hypothetical protein
MLERHADSSLLCWGVVAQAAAARKPMPVSLDWLYRNFSTSLPSAVAELGGRLPLTSKTAEVLT